MRKYFGTDGIRGVANIELTPELAFKVAKASSYVISKANGKVPTILIGKDTRISGSLIESSMVAGFLSSGAHVKLLGVIPTPGVAYLTKKYNADAGVVISASHNSFEFNGIKYFSNLGMKISDEIEEQIEEIIESTDLLNSTTVYNEEVGTCEQITEGETDYLNLFVQTFVGKMKLRDDFVVGIDASNGATYKIAEEIFQKLNIKYQIIHNHPDGGNINEKCGSTHLESLKEYVVKNNLSLGVAFDGDGDRCLAIDENGNEVNGDQILAIVSKFLKDRGALDNNALVVTVMSNLGVTKFAKENGIHLETTAVGDRYVLENMLKNGHIIGGEESGHIIMLKYNPTGDGMFTAITLIQIMLETNQKLSELCKVISIYPQVLINAKVQNTKKYGFEKDEVILAEIKKLEEEFSGNGRVLIRPSGTEPKVRVMIEGEDIDYITKKAKEIAALIEERLK